MERPFDQLPSFIEKTGLDKKTAEYILARLISKQTTEHIISRSEIKIEKTYKNIDRVVKNLKKTTDPLKKEKREEALKGFLAGIEKQKKVISYLNSLTDKTILDIN